MGLLQIGSRHLMGGLVFGVSLLSMLPLAKAGPLAMTNLALNNGAGPDAGTWHGTAVVAGANLGDTIAAEVDWAVFAPGAFQQYLNSQAIAQVDPSGPGEVVYAYQISSVTFATPGIDTLSVGIDAPDTRGIVSAPAFIPTGAATEKSPNSGGDNTMSMVWFFNGSELDPGDTSSILIFSSPNAPEFDFLQANSGLAGPVVSPLVGSPSNLLFVPEPAALLLGLFGCCSLLAVRRR
jgi:hypothetical protein